MQIDEELLFERCFRGHAAAVHSYALRRADREAAQDVTAETFLIAWRRRAEMPETPLPWLYGIARGVLANERRAANRRHALAAHLAAAPRAPGAGSPGEHHLLEALAALREADREALLLSAWEGLSIRETAGVLGCSAPAAAVRLHRARRRLGHLLAEIDAQANRVCANVSLPEASA